MYQTYLYNFTQLLHVTQNGDRKDKDNIQFAFKIKYTYDVIEPVLHVSESMNLSWMRLDVRLK